MQFGLWRAVAFVSSPIHLLLLLFQAFPIYFCARQITFPYCETRRPMIDSYTRIYPVVWSWSAIPLSSLKAVICPDGVCRCTRWCPVHCWLNIDSKWCRRWRSDSDINDGDGSAAENVFVSVIRLHYVVFIVRQYISLVLSVADDSCPAVPSSSRCWRENTAVFLSYDLARLGELLA